MRMDLIEIYKPVNGLNDFTRQSDPVINTLKQSLNLIEWG